MPAWASGTGEAPRKSGQKRRAWTKAGDEAWREGLSMASELVGALREVGAAGVYVMPQFGRFDLAAEIVETAARAR